MRNIFSQFYDSKMFFGMRPYQAPAQLPKPIATATTIKIA